MTTRDNLPRASASANNAEDYEHFSRVSWDADIGDPINLIIRIDCTTGGLRKVLKCTKECLKIRRAKKDGDAH